ncbi:hypothetical protein FPCIR_12784, partial [Fusarium pseudocircinatum]
QVRQIEEQVSIPCQPPPIPLVVQRTLEQLAERQPVKRQLERQAEQQPEPPLERQPEQQPERGPKQCPDLFPKRLRELISVGVHENVEVAQCPHEVVHRRIYDSPQVSPSRLTTVPTSDYAPECMITPATSSPPAPFQSRSGPQKTAYSVFTPSARYRTPRDALYPSTENDNDTKDTRGSKTAQTPYETKQASTVQAHRVHPGFTPVNGRSRLAPPEQGRPTPLVLPIDHPSHPPKSLPAPPPGDEITRENMVLKNNGVVYTYPECVKGVPLVKITETHPYWEPNWPNVKTIIMPQLARWREKRQAAIDAGPKQGKSDPFKYQTGRQVNRGERILEFHENGPISPHQLLSKKYIQPGKGSITSYDTLFRLAETISELEKFNLDISPVDWMRQRLHELIEVQGANFNLPRIIHEFYHDSKLAALRYKYGFKNIGRPSGVMKTRISHGSPSSSPRSLQKRKAIHSVTPKSCEDSFTDQSLLPSQLPPAPLPASGLRPALNTRLNKRPEYSLLCTRSSS